MNDVPGKSVKEQLEAEKKAAIRSLETNLILIAIYILSNIFLIFPSKDGQLIFCLVNSSIQKTLLPIATTVANFGTIKSVCFDYWLMLTSK